MAVAFAPVAGRRRWRAEVLIVLGLSLGQSAVYAILRLIDRLTQAVPLADQTAAMNTSASPKPWLDLLYQLAGSAFGVMPALLALFFLAAPGGNAGNTGNTGNAGNATGAGNAGNATGAGNADNTGNATGGNWAGARRIGLTLARPARDLAWGAALAGGIGLPGIALYLAGRELGLTVHISTASLDQYWWTIPVLVLAALQNGLLEEVVAVAYLAERLTAMGWPAWAWIAGSALLRGSYHLYQGFGPFIGNVAMGLVFAWFYHRWRRVMPLVVAHTLIDVVAFVGPSLLDPAWLS
ncbi:MAG: CPBP family intramembrane metalloprotease [Bifidobacteriaceae bacterium]|jgi:membrane protease YdiL (CAAX protease family)|nr:CPBP family intramembrane metalloprotease [Bifidobacteriaceae bacterium]